MEYPQLLVVPQNKHRSQKTRTAWRYRCRTEEPPLGGPDTQLQPPYGVKWTIRYLFKYTSRHGGPGHFRDQFENLQDDSVNWTPYSVYHDDLPSMYYAHFNL
jgi:hypothetical protein